MHARWPKSIANAARFIKDHFRKDPAEPHQYDLLLNISRWSVAKCTDQIVAALSQLKKQVAKE